MNYSKSHAVTKHPPGLIVKVRSSRKLPNGPRISQGPPYITHSIWTIALSSSILN